MAQHSLRAKEGRLHIDNRLAPPLTEAEHAEVARLEATGVHVVVAPAGQQFEAATHTCAHCHVIVLRNPQRTRARGYCAKCHAYLCDSPTCNAECRPMKQKLDRLQERLYQQGR